MPVHKTSRTFLIPFVERLEGDGEFVDTLTFDGETVWVVTYIPTPGPRIKFAREGDRYFDTSAVSFEKRDDAS